MAERVSRRCKRAGEGEITVMEVGHEAIRSATVEISSLDYFSNKRRKIHCSDLLQSSASSGVQLLNQCRRIVCLPEDLLSPAAYESSDDFSGPPCSSNESSEPATYGLRSSDLKAEGYDAETFRFRSGGFSSNSSKVCRDSAGMELSSAASPHPLENSRRKPAVSAGKMPSSDEIEGFFSVAEKSEQKRFADKYNYDILKDVPLEGRYQWVQLKS